MNNNNNNKKKEKTRFFFFFFFFLDLFVLGNTYKKRVWNYIGSSQLVCYYYYTYYNIDSYYYFFYYLFFVCVRTSRCVLYMSGVCASLLTSGLCVRQKCPPASLHFLLSHLKKKIEVWCSNRLIIQVPSIFFLFKKKMKLLCSNTVVSFVSNWCVELCFFLGYLCVCT